MIESTLEVEEIENEVVEDEDSNLVVTRVFLSVPVDVSGD